MWVKQQASKWSTHSPSLNGLAACTAELLFWWWTTFVQERFQPSHSLCHIPSSLIDINDQSQPCIKGYPKVTSSINTVGWLPEKMNWLGCAYEPLQRSLWCSLGCWCDPPFAQPCVLVAELWVQAVDEQHQLAGHGCDSCVCKEANLTWHKGKGMFTSY
jgi:hypothetical protein